jgi:hypothetical protein
MRRYSPVENSDFRNKWTYLNAGSKKSLHSV